MHYGDVKQANSYIKGAYVFSCGKNMGAFKAVGYPEDVGEFYRLDEYDYPPDKFRKLRILRPSRWSDRAYMLWT